MKVSREESVRFVRWVVANRSWLRVVAVVLGAAVLLWGNQVSMERLWWSLAAVVVGLAAVEILVGAGEDNPAGTSLPPPDTDVEPT